MKRLLLVGMGIGLGLMTAAAGQGLGLLGPDKPPSGATGAGPRLLTPGGPTWHPSPPPPNNPHPYDDRYPAGTGGARTLSA